jgi:hypothetical protein
MTVLVKILVINCKFVYKQRQSVINKLVLTLRFKY